MADKHQDYLARASEVDRMAQEATTAESKSAYEAIAKIWRDLAKPRPTKPSKE